MPEQSDNINKRAAAYRILAGEVVITALIALLFLAIADVVTAWSALLGGLAYILPNILFVRFVFRHSAAESPQRAVSGLFIGEAVKLMSTAVLFALCFILVKPLSVVGLFSTFIMMVFINLVGIARIMK